MVDSKGILNRERIELEEEYHAKWQIALKTNSEGRTGGLKEAVKGADVLIAMSTPGPGVIPKEIVSAMANDSIIFACANPIPEIWTREARESRGRTLEKSRIEFPN